MTGRQNSRGNRRAFFAGAGLAGVSILSGQFASAQTGDMESVTDGDCSTDDGVDLFVSLLNQQRILHDVPEYQPQADWKSVSHPYLMQPLFVPPGWEAEWAVCTDISRDGEPTWEADPTIDPASTLSLSRVTAPRGKAVFEHVSGVVQGTALTLEQVLAITRLSMVDPDDRIRPVCSNLLLPDYGGGIWQIGERVGLNIRVSTGLFYPVEDILSYTVIQAQSAISRRRDMEDAMELLFPMFVQCLPPPRRGGGGSEPTPTATPLF